MRGIKRRTLPVRQLQNNFVKYLDLWTNSSSASCTNPDLMSKPVFERHWQTRLGLPGLDSNRI